MMNHKSGDTTTNGLAEAENWRLVKKGFGARDWESNVFSEFRNETDDRGLKKHFIADEIYRIIKYALEGVGRIKSRRVEEQAKDLVSDIVDLIVDLKSRNVDINRIPPLHAVALDDGSFLIEWIFSKYRVGFSLERKRKESIWYLVSTIEETIEASGPLSSTNYKKLLAELILFVFGYS